MRKILSLAIFMAIIIGAFSQTNNNEQTKNPSEEPLWIEMMQDPEANFFETQKAFYAYWEGREIKRGSGYKPFKRWENFMRTRVDEYGNKPKSSQFLTEYNALMDKVLQDKSAQGNWQLLGPVSLPNPESGQPNGMGRINVIAFHPINPDIIYVGAPAGGFWRSLDGGETWETTTDRLPTLGVSAIVVNPDDPNIIYIGTGDRDADDAYGMGVYKSINGGLTWERKSEGLGDKTVNKLLIHPNYPEILIAATSSGIYKSIDSGENWDLKTSGNSKFMEFKPTDPDIIYAIKSTSLYKSDDNGESWNKVTNGLIGWSNAVLGVTVANPDYVYILAANGKTFKALYKSTNSGESFTTMSTSPNIMGYSQYGNDNEGQAWYDLCMTVDPVDPEVVFAGGVNIWKSEDGGKNWDINTHWVGSGAPAVHADQHDLTVNPLNNRIYAGNDGGIYYTKNGGSTWVNISEGISISQIYKIGQSAVNRDEVLAGNQDNGTSFYDNGFWRVIMGGDGMECVFDHETGNYTYASLYYGAIRRSKNGGYFYSITDNLSEEGAWVTPYVLNENNAKIMYVGMKNIWRTNNAQSTYVSWTNISANISTSGNFNILENSPANSDILYAVRSGGVFRTLNANDASPDWMQLSGLPSSSVTDIEAHPTDENIVYVCAGNYQVYKSTNRGGLWKKITGSLPKVPYNTIAYDKTSNEGLYLGTDIGIFYKDATMSDWVYYSNGFPASAKVTELEIYYDDENPENNVIRASTYGRGLWESDLFEEAIVAENDARIIEILSPKGTYYPNDSITPEIAVKNIGSGLLTTVGIAHSLDNNDHDTTYYNVNLSTYEVATIQLPKITVNTGTHIYHVTIISANESEVLSTVASGFDVYETNAIKLELTTDVLASETSWSIINEAEETLYSSEVYVDDSIYNMTEYFQLTSGCYKFIMVDVNGIQGGGLYTLTNISTTQELGTGADFAVADTVEFCINEFPVVNFSVSPSSAKIGDAVTFINKTEDNAYTYLWNFGEGATPQTATVLEAPEVTYSTEGYKNISLLVSNNGNKVAKYEYNYVKIYSEPTIVLNPLSQTLCESETLVLEAKAEGFDLSYQWYHEGNALSSETNNVLKIENVHTANAGDYYCKVSNNFYNVNSEIAKLTLKAQPELSVTVTEEVVCSGTEVSLTAEGTGEFSWSNNLGTGGQVSVTPAKTTTYFVSLTNDGCTTTKELTVFVAKNPSINVHPENKTVCEGKSVSMMVNADGGALSYMWKLNGEDFMESNSVLYIDSAKASYQGNITCEVVNVCGTSVSNSAYLTVSPLPIAGFSTSVDQNKVSFIDGSEHASSYNWNFGDGTTSTMIEPTHTYEAGSYRPVQEVENDCGTDTIGFNITIYPDGVDELHSNENLTIYPNPAIGPFSVELTSDYIGIVKSQVINIEGKVIEQQVIDKLENNLVIPFNLSEYTKGLYQLQIWIGNRVVNKKVLIN